MAPVADAPGAPPFYKMSEFSVNPGWMSSLFGGGGTETAMPFPDYMLMSDNHFKRAWRVGGARRLKNAIAVMEWVPDKARLSDRRESTELSPAQNAHLDAIFNLFDIDGNGSIAPDEFHKVLDTLEVFLDAEQEKALIDELGDASGAISLERMKQAIAGAPVALRSLTLETFESTMLERAPAFAPAPAESQQHIAAEACLRFFDSTSRWTAAHITWAERCLQSADRDLRKSYWRDVRALRRRPNRVIEHMTTLNRLFVEPDEYGQLAVRATIMRVKVAMRARQLKAADLFLKLDRNRDGVLSAKEITEGLVYLGIQRSWLGRDDIAAVIAACDSVEKDGVLTMAEFKDTFEVDVTDPIHFSTVVLGDDAEFEAEGQQDPCLSPTALARSMPLPELAAAGRFRLNFAEAKGSDFGTAVWTSRGTLCATTVYLWLPAAAAKAKGGIFSGVWGGRAEAPKLRANFGCYATPDASPPQGALLLEAEDNGDGVRDDAALKAWADRAFPAPLRFRQVWAFTQPGRPSVYLWRPIPPDRRFVGLGFHCTTTDAEPLPAEAGLRCFPKKWCRRFNPKEQLWQARMGNAALRLWRGNQLGLAAADLAGAPPQHLSPDPSGPQRAAWTGPPGADDDELGDDDA
eukprot:gene16659-20998_t